MDRTPQQTTYTGPRPSTTPSRAIAMGPPPNPTKKFDISTLLSPPDHAADSFAQTNDGSVNALQLTSQNAVNQQGKVTPLISPPTSPAKRHAITTLEATSPQVRDPVLFPQDDSSELCPSQSPLFQPIDSDENRRLVNYHIRYRPTFPENASPPSPEDYELVLQCRPRVNALYAANPKKYYRRERALLQEENDIINKENKARYASIAPRTKLQPAPIAKVAANRVSKPKKPSTNAARVPRAGEAKPFSRVSQTPEPSRRIVAPNREDKDFNSLPDLCPDKNTLPDNPHCLKIDWKGQALDLSTDPHAHLLHPAEVNLAGILRLDCATYLTSKKRMFIRRLQCLQKPKEFRKTDAQQACKIDVNKASKLWTAFDKVGWLHESYMAEHRHKIIDIE